MRERPRRRLRCCGCCQADAARCWLLGCCPLPCCQSSPLLFAFAAEGASSLLSLLLRDAAAAPLAEPRPLSPAQQRHQRALARLWAQRWQATGEATDISDVSLRALLVLCRSSDARLVLRLVLPVLLQEQEEQPLSSSPLPSLTGRSLSALASLCIAHPDVLTAVLPRLLSALLSAVDPALSAQLLTALQHIVSHCCSPPAASPPLAPLASSRGLPDSLLSRLCLFVTGLLFAASERTAMLDGALLSAAGRLLSRIVCALPSQSQLAVLLLLAPALTEGRRAALAAGFEDAAAELGVVGPLPAVVSALHAPLLALSAPPACHALLELVCPMLACARPDCLQQVVQQQTALLPSLEAFAMAGMESAPATAPVPAVRCCLELVACLANKLPSASPALSTLLAPDAGLLRCAFALLSPAALCCLQLTCKALLMRGHPLSSSLLTRYSLLPSAAFASSSLPPPAAVLSCWADGFRVLVTELPLLSAASHSAVSAGLLYRQRSLAVALPCLSSQIAQRLERKREAAKRGGDGSAGAGVGEQRLLDCLLLAVVQLLSHLPFAVLNPKLEQALPLLMQAVGSASPACRLPALLALAACIDQPGFEPALLAPHLPLLLPVLLSVCDARQLRTAEEVQAALAALRCIGFLCRLPYSALFPSRLAVSRCLQSMVDARQRAVRKEAMAVRLLWTTTMQGGSRQAQT